MKARKKQGIKIGINKLMEIDKNRKEYFQIRLFIILD